MDGNAVTAPQTRGKGNPSAPLRRLSRLLLTRAARQRAKGTQRTRTESTLALTIRTRTTLSYTYDADWNRASALFPGISALLYGYTGRGQLKTVTNSADGAHVVDYTYDKSGNMATRAPQNNTSSTFLYDALNRVTNVTHNFTGATGTLAYAYDEVGNRKYMQRGNGLTDGFGYDLNSQVTSFRRNGTLTGGTVTGGTLTSLVFDASGNRTSVVENGTTTSYPSANNLNQYPSVGGKGATYDGKGNLYSYDGWTYTYDALYRLTAATGPGVTANFYYDGLNRQVARTITGSTTKFSVWDGWDLYAEYDSNKVQTNRWIRAGNDLIRSPSPGLLLSGRRGEHHLSGRHLRQPVRALHLRPLRRAELRRCRRDGAPLAGAITRWKTSSTGRSGTPRSASTTSATASSNPIGAASSSPTRSASPATPPTSTATAPIIRLTGLIRMGWMATVTAVAIKTIPQKNTTKIRELPLCPHSGMCEVTTCQIHSQIQRFGSVPDDSSLRRLGNAYRSPLNGLKSTTPI